MNILITRSSILRSIEYILILVGGSVSVSLVFRYLMSLGQMAPVYFGLPLLFVIFPIILTLHHYTRVFSKEAGIRKLTYAVGLALFSLTVISVGAFKVYEYLFSPYNYGPGP